MQRWHTRVSSMEYRERQKSKGARGHGDMGTRGEASFRVAGGGLRWREGRGATVSRPWARADASPTRPYLMEAAGQGWPALPRQRQLCQHAVLTLPQDSGRVADASLPCAAKPRAVSGWRLGTERGSGRPRMASPTLPRRRYSILDTPYSRRGPSLPLYTFGPFPRDGPRCPPAG